MLVKETEGAAGRGAGAGADAVTTRSSRSSSTVFWYDKWGALVAKFRYFHTDLVADARNSPFSHHDSNGMHISSSYNAATVQNLVLYVFMDLSSPMEAYLAAGKIVSVKMIIVTCA